MRQENSHRLRELLTIYGETHQNPINKRIHYICVPAIFLSIIWLLLALPAPQAFGLLNWAFIAALFVYFYYRRMSRFVALGFFLMCTASWLAQVAWEHALPGTSIYAAGILFVVAWIGQFYGHHLEGKRPAFLQDLQFLLIGPAWILTRLYDHLKWRY